MITPHWAPPTHALQIWRYCEQGSIGPLWISGTNPATSLPELPRIRKILQQDSLFTIVQDGFLTETARYADDCTDNQPVTACGIIENIQTPDPM